jgi:hypothetical protein
MCRPCGAGHDRTPNPTVSRWATLWRPSGTSSHTKAGRPYINGGRNFWRDRFLACLFPRIFRQIDDDQLRRTSDYNPSEGRVLRPVDFPVHEPCGHVDKITGARGEGMLSAFAPLHERFAFEDVRDGFLRAVIMDACLRSGFNQKRSAPERRLNSNFWRHGCEARRARRLRSSCAELIGMDDANRGRFVLGHSRFDDLKRLRLQSYSVFSVSSVVESEKPNTEFTEDHRVSQRLLSTRNFPRYDTARNLVISSGDISGAVVEINRLNCNRDARMRLVQ